MSSPGVHVVRPMLVYGYDDAPHGHAEVHFKAVRVPADNIILVGAMFVCAFLPAHIIILLWCVCTCVCVCVSMCVCVCLRVHMHVPALLHLFVLCSGIVPRQVVVLAWCPGR